MPVTDETEPAATDAADETEPSWRDEESTMMKEIRDKRRKGIRSRFIAFRGTLGFRGKK